MAIRLTTTREASKFIKCLVYGESGMGKTWLIKTCPKPLIISAEKGLMTLSDQDIPVIEINTYEDLEEAFEFVTTREEAKEFETICFDSISDIAENVIADLKAEYPDPRKAYGDMADKLLAMVKKFRDITNKNIYFIAKAKRVKDDFTGITSWMPSAPGKQLAQALPYLFDYVFPLRMGVTGDGVEYRYLQTNQDIQCIAKSRSVHQLEDRVEPHLGKLFSMALGETEPEQTQQVDTTSDEAEETEGDE
ncbi:MAG: ATP-binding protein [bacterium]|nr:ATP-binding protein [bacterium]